MKKISYNLVPRTESGDSNAPFDKVITCADEYLAINIEIAKREADNGEYTIEDDGQPELDTAPTLEERVGTVEDDVSDLFEALDMILNEVTE